LPEFYVTIPCGGLSSLLEDSTLLVGSDTEENWLLRFNFGSN